MPEQKKWIQKAIKHKGGLHRALGIPEGQKIPESKIREAAKGSGHVARMARFALVLKGFKK